MNYHQIYFQIIDRAKLRPIPKMSKKSKLDGHEKHHILPICCGGTNESANLVFLTPREHFICHALLVKFCDPAHLSSLRYALGMMRGTRTLNSRLFEFARKQHSLAQRNRLLGSKLSDETKARISKALTGQKRTAEQCKNISNSQLGKTLSEEHKKKLSESTKGKTRILSETHKAALKGKRGPWTEAQREARKLCAEKIRLAHVGRKRSAETKAKISLSRKKINTETAQ